jgi:hypothetical protein
LESAIPAYFHLASVSSQGGAARHENRAPCKSFGGLRAIHRPRFMPSLAPAQVPQPDAFCLSTGAEKFIQDIHFKLLAQIDDFRERSGKVGKQMRHLCASGGLR